jgi:hypothetical protein
MLQDPARLDATRQGLCPRELKAYDGQLGQEEQYYTGKRRNPPSSKVRAHRLRVVPGRTWMSWLRFSMREGETLCEGERSWMKISYRSGVGGCWLSNRVCLASRKCPADPTGPHLDSMVYIALTTVTGNHVIRQIHLADIGIVACATNRGRWVIIAQGK